MSVDLEIKLRRNLAKLKGALYATPADVRQGQSSYEAVETNIDDLLDDRKITYHLSERLWSDALLLQAQEDLSAVEILTERAGSPSVRAMLLQMVFEKLAKAALARVSIEEFKAHRSSHVAASKMVRLIKLNASYYDLRIAWKDVLPMIQELERAHPALAKRGPHLEYPWEQETIMGHPSQHLIVQQLADPLDMRGPKLVRFARELCNKFNNIFP
jgi:hypothetical protein